MLTARIEDRHLSRRGGDQRNRDHGRHCDARGIITPCSAFSSCKMLTWNSRATALTKKTQRSRPRESSRRTPLARTALLWTPPLPTTSSTHSERMLLLKSPSRTNSPQPLPHATPSSMLQSYSKPSFVYCLLVRSRQTRRWCRNPGKHYCSVAVHSDEIVAATPSQQGDLSYRSLSATSLRETSS